MVINWVNFTQVQMPQLADLQKMAKLQLWVSYNIKKPQSSDYIIVFLTQPNKKR